MYFFCNKHTYIRKKLLRLNRNRLEFFSIWKNIGVPKTKCHQPVLFLQNKSWKKSLDNTRLFNFNLLYNQFHIQQCAIWGHQPVLFYVIVYICRYKRHQFVGSVIVLKCLLSCFLLYFWFMGLLLLEEILLITIHLWEIAVILVQYMPSLSI